MIKNRLRITLFMVVAVVLGLGFGSMTLVHSHTQRFDELLEDEHQAIMAVNSIVYHANMLNDVLALPSPGDSPADTGDGESAEAAARLRASREHVEELHTQRDQLGRHVHTAAERAAYRRLHGLVESLLDHAAEGMNQAETGTEAGLRRLIAADTRAIAMVAQELISANDARVFADLDLFEHQTRHALIYVGLLIAVACLVICAIYWQFNSLALTPIATLTESVREVGRRNFELSLPVKREDEIGALSQAYNEMAAELRHLHRETDEHIVALNAQNRALLTAFPHSVMVVDAEGSFIQINPEAEKFLEDIGTPGRLPAKLKKLFHEVRESGETFLPDRPDEAMLFRIDEREYYFLPRIMPLPPIEDLPESWALILSDVSRFRWLDDMKMNALATVSHELRTPLTSIRMYLHLLQEKKVGPLNKTQDDMVTSASDDCERLLKTLNNVLDVTRLGSGSQHLERKPLDPQVFLGKLPSEVDEQASEKGVSIEVEAADSLPRVLADELGIRQVLENLLSNAIRFSPAESRVALKVRREGEEFVRFSITDHGPGVPPEFHDRLFERFFRAPGQRGKGLGLGLSISREIVAAHDGRIGFSSEEGEPTTFYFDLPVV